MHDVGSADYTDNGERKRDRRPDRHYCYDNITQRRVCTHYRHHVVRRGFDDLQGKGGTALPSGC